MSTSELTKGAIAKFISGVTDTASNGHESSPVLLQVVDIQEDTASTPSTTVFMLSDGINSCRAIYKSPAALSGIKALDVVTVEGYELAYVNGLVMVLHNAPRVIHTNVGKLLGKPQDYATMALKAALKDRNKVDATIPTSLQGVPAEENPKPQQEEMKVEKPQQKHTENKSSEPSITLLKDLRKDQIKWTIKIRVTKKHESKSCKAGTGRMQKIDVVDQASTEMSVLLFDDAVASVGENLEEGGVYYIIDGKVRQTMGQTRGVSNNLTIFADKRTRVQRALDDNSIPRAVFNFVEFEDIGKHKGGNIDILGKAKDQGSYARDPLEKREILLSDDHGHTIGATLWRGLGSKIDFSKEPIVAIKSIFVKEYSGRLCLASHDDTQIIAEMGEAQKKPSEPANNTNKPEKVEEKPKVEQKITIKPPPKEVRNYRTIKEIAKDKDKAPGFFTLTCVFQSFSDLFYYTGCPNCKKKIPYNEAKGKCANCHTEYEELAYIYTFSVLMSDGSDRCWGQVFGQIGEAIFGIKAKELAEWHKSGERQNNHPMVQATLCKKFTVGVKKKKIEEGDYKLVIEKIYPAGHREQNVGFLRRLELYENYIMD